MTYPQKLEREPQVGDLYVFIKVLRNPIGKMYHPGDLLRIVGTSAESPHRHTDPYSVHFKSQEEDGTVSTWTSIRMALDRGFLELVGMFAGDSE